MNGVAKPYVIYDRHGKVERDTSGKIMELSETEAQTKVHDSGGSWEFFPGRAAIRFVGSAKPGVSVRPNANFVERYAAVRASNPGSNPGSNLGDNPSDELIAAVDGVGPNPAHKRESAKSRKSRKSRKSGESGGWRKSGN